MKQQCRTRVSSAIGREISVAEANFIEGRISRAATALARADIKAWRAMTPAQQTLAATERAASEIEAAARSMAAGSETMAQAQQGTKRGDIVFPSSGMGRGAPSMIRLYQARDMSTFLHESGHYFLEMMATLAAETDAAPGIVKLHQDARAWFDATWDGMSEARQSSEIERWGSRRVWEHELFARTFEAYLMDGKAPSTATRSMFAAFKDWLTRIYKSILGLERSSGQVALTPEIKAVFDRMLATDEEIAAAQMEMGVGALPQATLKLNDEQYARYVTQIEDARRQAEEALRAEVEEAFRRQQQADWRREQRRYRRTAELEINGLPTYRAAEWIGRGRWLNGAAPGALADGMEANAERAAAEAAEAMRVGGFDGMDFASAREALRAYQALPAEQRSWAMERELIAEVFEEARARQRLNEGRRMIGYAHAPEILASRGPLTETFEQFVGPRALTSDWIALERAFEMTAQGAPMDTVRRETGWFKDSVGQWQYELSDETVGVKDHALWDNMRAVARAHPLQAGEAAQVAQLDVTLLLDTSFSQFQSQTTLGEIYDAKQLFEAYPSLADTPLVFIDGPDIPFRGMAVGPNTKSGTPAFMVVNADVIYSDHLIEVLTHEVQHLIQFEEGWHVGGGPDRAQLYLDLADGATYDKVIARIQSEKKPGEPVYLDDIYRVLAGEDQAFETQRRMDMTAKERLAEPPVLVNQQALPTFPHTDEGKRDIAIRLKQLMVAGAQAQSLSVSLSTEAREADGFTLFQRDTDLAIEPKPEDLLPMKLSPDGVADYVDEFGPDVAERLRAYIERGDRRDVDTVVREIARAKRAKPAGQRMWEWVISKGGVNDGDINARVSLPMAKDIVGPRRIEKLFRDDGRTVDDLARAAVEEGIVELQKDADGYIVAEDLDAFRERLIADLAGDPQYPANAAAENEAYGAAQGVLQDWEAMGVNTGLTGADLRESVRDAIARESARAVHPEDAAAAFGFPSGSALIRALLEMTPRPQAIERAAEAAMARDGLTDPFTDGTIERQAKRLSHNEARARVLELEMDAIERATGGRKRPLAAAAKDIAERQARAMTVRQLMNPDQFIAAERRFGLAAQRALEKGDATEASRAKHRQLVAFYLYRAASRASEQVDKTLTKWKRLATNANTRKAIAPAHLAQIDALLEELQVSPRAGVERESLEDWAATMEAVGLKDLVAFNPGVVEERVKQPVHTMAYEDFDGLAEAIANIEFIGRNVTKLQKMKSAQDFDALKGQLLQRLQQEWPEKIEKNVSRVAPRPIERNLEGWKEFYGAQIKVDYLARLLDGLKDNGPWAQTLAIPAQAAQDDLTRREIAAMTQFREILNIHGVDAATLKRWMTTRIQINEIGDARTMHQLISYALNTGNAYNREALLAGEGWDAVQLQAVLSRLGKREWDLVQSLWDYVGQWKEESFALDERTRGVRPQSVEPEAVVTPHGRYAGGYWPVSFDPQLSDRAAQREAKAIAEGEMGAAYRRPATHRGRLKSRQGTGGQALMSDWFAVLDKHVRDTLVDITHRELVMDLARLKADGEVRSSVQAVAGRDALKALDAWIYRLSRKVELRQFGEAQLAKYLNRTHTISSMAFKFSVGALNLLGAFQAIPRNGVLAQLKQTGITLGRDFPQMLLSEAGRMLGGPGEMSARVRFVRAKSSMMENRIASFDRDMQDENTVGEVKRGVEQPIMSHAMRGGRYLTGLIDTVISIPTWIAAYENALAGKVGGIAEMDEAAAVAHADNVVRNTQGAGSRKDLAAMMATSNEWQRMHTLFMNWASGFANQIFMEQVPGVIAGKISPTRFGVNMAFIWLLPAVITLAFFGKLEPGDDETDEEYAARLAATIAAYPGQSVPFVRDAVSLLAEGRQPMPPLAAVADRAGRLRTAVEQENERQIVKQAYMLTGSVTGLPVQGYITGDYIADSLAGEEDPADLLNPETAGDAWREALVNDKR